MSACISKHHSSTSHTEKEPKPPGNTLDPNENTRDLRGIINYRRKGKTVVSNDVIDAPAALTPAFNANDPIANDDRYPHLHVPVVEPLVEPPRSEHVEVASPDDFNYEDPLIAELLDKNWNAEDKRQNAPHFTNIEAVEEMNKGSDRDTCPSMVPNSRSEETPPKIVENNKNFFRGETSRQRCPDDQLLEHSPPSESEGEEELTPVSNRFQSLEDMETNDIFHLIESTRKNTPTDKDYETGGSNVEAQGHRSRENTNQEMILTDSTASHRHKRNKSLEEDMPKSLKTGEPFVQLDVHYYTRKFGFYSVFANANNKIWCFAKFGVDIQIIQDHSQFLHVKVSSGIIPTDIICTFVYAKCYRNPRRILWEELVKLSNQDIPWIVGGDFNVILHPNENQGGDMQRLGPMDDFNDMMLDTGLIDAGFEGDSFTWTNKRI
ncbi:UNVERIFIED_CONTAM: hypothetical protein Slati_0168000 [Sesamum latifolium]|uniref:Reverse transcriptase n=1 Tax=Sesamum latifolium TaxID=2727402 RepID=A0AAW2YAM2_9LAMI